MQQGSGNPRQAEKKYEGDTCKQMVRLGESCLFSNLFFFSRKRNTRGISKDIY